MLELMFPSPRQYFLIILLVFVTACSNETTALPTKTPFQTVASPTPIPTFTSIPVVITSSPLPTQPTIPIFTPDAIQMERWREYEVALAMKLLPPNPLRGEVLCEWELLGRSDQEVYVWAFCQSPPYTEDLPPSIASMPAVVHLGNDGDVQGVEIPGGGSAYARNIRKMFPPDVQEIIFRHSIDTEKMEAHINSRRENQNPPSIVLSATPMP